MHFHGQVDVCSAGTESSQAARKLVCIELGLQLRAAQGTSSTPMHSGLDYPLLNPRPSGPVLFLKHVTKDHGSLNRALGTGVLPLSASPPNDSRSRLLSAVVQPPFCQVGSRTAQFEVGDLSHHHPRPSCCACFSL